MDVIDRVLAFWFEDGFDKRRKAWKSVIAV